MTAARDFLAAVQQRADAATSGPWSRHDYGNAAAQEPETIVVHTGKFDWTDLSDPEGTSAVAWMGAWDSQEDRNAEFIAASRTDVPALVAALTAVLNAEDVVVQGIGHEVYAAGSIDPEECTEDCPACAIDEMYAAITDALTPKETDS